LGVSIVPLYPSPPLKYFHSRILHLDKHLLGSYNEAMKPTRPAGSYRLALVILACAGGLLAGCASPRPNPTPNYGVWYDEPQQSAPAPASGIIVCNSVGDLGLAVCY
jgi:hypothetical protein